MVEATLPACSLSDLVGESHAALFALSLDGRILMWNRRAEAIFGYTADEAIGRRLVELTVPDDRCDEADQALAAIADRGSMRFTTVRRRKDGRLVDVDVSMRHVASEDPHIVASEIEADTDRKRMEQALASAEQAAELAGRELEAFNHAVAHDLRTPLRGIDGFSLALLEDYAASLDPEAKHYLERMRELAQHMARMIDSLNVLARLTQAHIKRQHVDLTAIARTVAAQLEREHASHRPEVVISDGMSCNGDRHLLGIVVANLLDNAWKFTGKRPGARIEFAHTCEGGQGVFFVRDNGAGFDMVYAEKLFTAFKRLHAKHEFDGIGIGLATVQRIVRRHGGRIWARGELDRGATFFFTLDNAS